MSKYNEIESDSSSGEEVEYEGNTRNKRMVRNIEDEYTKLREELVGMTFEEREKLKQKIGLKMYMKIMKRGSAASSGSTAPKTFKRENKNRPQEISSKKPPPKLREVVQVKKKKHRDPRFDPLCGEYDEKLFKQSYSFIDDIKEKEKNVLLKKYKKEHDEEKKAEIKETLKQMGHREEIKKKAEKRAQPVKEFVRKERALVKEGKKPFYLKKSEQKKLELAEKFKELKKSGKIDKYMQKKRKRNAAKEKRKLPNT